MILTENIINAKSRGQCYPNIKQINLCGMHLTDISIMRNLSNLEVAVLSANDLTSLKDFANKEYLRELHIRKNQIEDIREVRFLKSVPNLRILALTDNPCVFRAGNDYRLKILHELPNLDCLDNVKVSDMERQAAESPKYAILKHTAPVKQSPTIVFQTSRSSSSSQESSPSQGKEDRPAKSTEESDFLSSRNEEAPASCVLQRKASHCSAKFQCDDDNQQSLGTAAPSTCRHYNEAEARERNYSPPSQENSPERFLDPFNQKETVVSSSSTCRMTNFESYGNQEEYMTFCQTTSKNVYQENGGTVTLHRNTETNRSSTRGQDQYSDGNWRNEQMKFYPYGNENYCHNISKADMQNSRNSSYECTTMEEYLPNNQSPNAQPPSYNCCSSYKSSKNNSGKSGSCLRMELCQVPTGRPTHKITLNSAGSSLLAGTLCMIQGLDRNDLYILKQALEDRLEEI